MSILDVLKDSGTNLKAIPEVQSSGKLAEKANNPASEAYVDNEFVEHVRTCPAIRKIQKWTMLLCLVTGIVLTLQVVALVAGKAILKETVRAAVREEMGFSTLAQRTDWVMPGAIAEKGSSL